MFISDPPSRGKDAGKTAIGFVSVKLAEVAAFGEGLPETFFDYGEVPEANRDELHQLTAAIKNAHRRHLAALVEIGESLLRAKKIAGHGNFLPWLAAEFSWSERTARLKMCIAEFFQGKKDLSYFLQISDLIVYTAKTKIEHEKGILSQKRINRGHHLLYNMIEKRILNTKVTKHRDYGILTV